MDCTLRAAVTGAAAVPSDRAQSHRGYVLGRPVHGSQFLASFCTPPHQSTTNQQSRQRSLAVTAAAPSSAAGTTTITTTTSRISSSSSRTVRVSITAPQPVHLHDRSRHAASAAVPVASAGSGSVSTATPETQNGTARAHAGAAADASASAEQQQQQAPILPAALAGGSVMTDETVPEGHKGLHGFLYGDSGADVHDSRSKVYAARAGEDDGSALVPLAAYIGSREGDKFAGVYAVFDAQGVPQYVGYSRNVVLSLKSHQSSEEVGAVCTGVRVKVFTDAALVTRSRMEEERQQWLQHLCQEAGLAELRGNTEELHLWEGPNGPGTAAMSAAERAEYEEKKLKLRKAMGENLYDDVEGETLDSKERRLALLQAVEGDDWSSVISNQTKSTLPVSDAQPAPSAAAATAADAAAVPDSGRKISPFEMRPGAAAAAAAVAPVLLSVEAVDEALNVVRPYLIADGGNVEVVGVEDGIVALRLQGACGTCPSSTATMKMGIERALVERFGDQIREVVQVNPYSDNIPTVATVDAHLDMLRPAINNFGGSVEVVSVNATAGECEVRYQGPAPIGMGIQAAIKDKFPNLRTVKLVD